MIHKAPPFTPAEFRRRCTAVADRLKDGDLDAIVVSYVLHVEYLTGTWASQFWLAPVIVTADGDAGFVVRTFETDRVRVESAVPIVGDYFDHADSVRATADALRRMGIDRARVGFELDNHDLTHHDVEELRSLLPAMDVVDASLVLPTLMAVKSGEELAAMATASRLTEVAVTAFADALVVGVTEGEVRDAMRCAVRAAGSDELRGGVAFGRNSALPHGGDSTTTLEAGDVAVTETSGYWSGYCATLCRTAVMGENPGATELYDVARAATEAAMEAMRPGATTGRVDDAARSVVAAAGKGYTFRHRSGYSVGLRANGRLNLGLRPGGTEILEEGMTFHTPILLFETGQYSVGCSETSVVTTEGGRPLSTIGRDLLRIH